MARHLAHTFESPDGGGEHVCRPMPQRNRWGRRTYSVGLRWQCECGQRWEVEDWAANEDDRYTHYSIRLSDNE
jgi:hypothetical protein